MTFITNRATGRSGLEGEGRKTGTNKQTKGEAYKKKLIMKEIKKGRNKYTSKQRRMKERRNEWKEENKNK
jgi:hypothetical protein